jgi:glucose/arabinose dehydrogenase
LSRFTVTDPTADVLTIDPNSEVVLVQGDQPATLDHQGGGLAFGPDGKLYWSVGDNVCCSVVDGSNAQDLSNIYGKVLRINPDGSAPSDNPYPNAPGAGPLIYATGFRNPFRLTFTPDGKLLVADVGQDAWEEVNLVTKGGNYGWPNAEGPCNGVGTTSCSTPSSYDNPIYAYPHDGSGNSITAIMVYTPEGASSGEKTVLIADFNQGWVRELTFNSNYSSLISATQFDAAAPGNTDMLAQGPDGAIYQLTFDGRLTRIASGVDPASV